MVVATSDAFAVPAPMVRDGFHDTGIDPHGVHLGRDRVEKVMVTPRLQRRAFRLGDERVQGIRVQAVAGTGEDGRMIARLYSRTGEDISDSFPDLIEALRLPGAIDGEL